jgi:hypothetical protein
MTWKEVNNMSPVNLTLEETILMVHVLNTYLKKVDSGEAIEDVEKLRARLIFALPAAALMCVR